MTVSMSPLPLLGRFRSLIQAYPPRLWMLGAITLLTWFGFSFVWPVITVHIHDHLGRSLGAAGFVLMLNQAGGMLGSLVGGWWFDRSGARPVLLVALLGSALLVIMIAGVTSWPLFMAVLCAYGFASLMPFPVLNALAGQIWPEGGRRAFNFLYVLANVGVAAGAAVGGLLAAVSFTVAFLSAALVALAAAGLVLVGVRMPRPAARGKVPGERKQVTAGRRIAWRPTLAIGGLVLGLLTCWMVYMQWQGPLAVYVQEQGLGLPRYSLLWTLNGLIVVLGQPLITLGLRRLPSLWGQLVLGVCLYAGAFWLLTSGAIYPALVAGMACLTLGEMLIHPGVPAAADQLAPPERRGLLQGLISSGATVGRMIGPLAGGVIFDRWGFPAIPKVSLVVLAVPMGAFVVYGLCRRPKLAEVTRVAGLGA